MTTSNVKEFSPFNPKFFFSRAGMRTRALIGHVLTDDALVDGEVNDAALVDIGFVARAFWLVDRCMRPNVGEVIVTFDTLVNYWEWLMMHWLAMD